MATARASWAALADLAGIDQGALSKYLNTDAQADVRTLGKLERAMRMAPGRLLIAATEDVPQDADPAPVGRE